MAHHSKSLDELAKLSEKILDAIRKAVRNISDKNTSDNTKGSKS